MTIKDTQIDTSFSIANLCCIESPYEKGDLAGALTVVKGLGHVLVMQRTSNTHADDYRGSFCNMYIGLGVIQTRKMCHL